MAQNDPKIDFVFSNMISSYAYEFWCINLGEIYFGNINLAVAGLFEPLSSALVFAPQQSEIAVSVISHCLVRCKICQPYHKGD